MEKRIYYHDTDCGGVVYYANYLKFLEEARTEFLEKRGVLIKELLKENIIFVVVRQEIEYKFPAFYADILSIDTRLAKLYPVRMEFDYEIKNESGKIICLAKTILACVDSDFKPIAIPGIVREKLTDF